MNIYTGHGMIRFLLVLVLVTLMGPARGLALDVNGIVDTDSRWTTDDSPIKITGDLLVAQGATLTIDPGVQVVFMTRADTARGYNLRVEGTLFARGTAANTISFTAQDPLLPWGAILFEDISADWDADQGTGSRISHCVIEYGGNTADFGMIVTRNAMPLIRDNAIRFSAGAGIAAFADDGVVTVGENLQIIDNWIYGNPIGLVMFAEEGVVTGNYFLSNGSAMDVTARSNAVVIQNNTISGASTNLLGSGIRLELAEPASGLAGYNWVQTGGPTVSLDSTDGNQASFVAPDPGSDVYVLTFELTATGVDGLRAADTVAVTVTGTNLPPVANAGSDANVLRTAGMMVTLSGVGSTDPDNGIASLFWEQESGTTVSLQDTDTIAPYFYIPYTVVAGEEMTFRLTVTDQGGLESTDTVTLRFYSDNIYPRAGVGEEMAAATAQTVELDGTGSVDPDGVIATYLWEQTDGTTVTLENADTATASFEVPAVADGGEVLTFALTVTDDGGLTDTETLTVRINPVAVDAGEDRTVSAGDEVILDGSGSIDPNASADIQIQHNTIVSDGDGAGLMAVTGVEEARYQLSFSENNLEFDDAQGYAFYLYDWDESTTEINITHNWWGSVSIPAIDTLIYDQADDFQLPSVVYRPVAAQLIAAAGSDLVYPPLANAGPDMETTMDAAVTLDGSQSYDPDGIGTYRWEQTEGESVTIRTSNQAVATFVAPSGGTDGRELRFSLTVSTGGPFTHTDEVVVTVVPDETVPLVEVGEGCFIGSTIAPSVEAGKGCVMMIVATLAMVSCLVLGSRKRRQGFAALFAVLLVVFIPSSHAGFFAVGGGGGGEAERYNITIETGAKDITAGSLEMMFAFGIPFIPHGDKNIPENTVAMPCPNDQCMSLGEERKGTEVGFYGKLGIEIGSTNLYCNLLGGFTAYTESELVRSTGSGTTFEESSDTVLEPLYGAGLSYFPDYWKWPILLQVDWDITRGVTGTIGWCW